MGGRGFASCRRGAAATTTNDSQTALPRQTACISGLNDWKRERIRMGGKKKRLEKLVFFPFLHPKKKKINSARPARPEGVPRGHNRRRRPVPRQRVQQARGARGVDDDRARLCGDKARRHRVVEKAQEFVIEAAAVEDSHGLGVHAQLLPGDLVKMEKKKKKKRRKLMFYLFFLGGGGRG